MGRARLYVDCTSIPLLSYEIKKDGERAVDEAKFKVIPSQNVSSNDSVKIVQDSFNLDSLSGVWTFQQHILNDSGNDVQPTGATGTPRSDIIYEFECNTTNCGFRNNTTTEFGGLVYTTGKPGSGTMALNLDGMCDYFTLSKECEFDYDLTTAMSFNTWIKTCSSVAAPIIAKKATGIASVGYDVSMDACGKIVFDLLNTATCDELKVTSDFTVNDGNWHMVTVTFSGIPCASQVKMYDNSAIGTFVTNLDTLSDSILNCSVVSIGAYADGSSKLTSAVDETRIIGAKQITQEEITSLYTHEIFEYVSGKFGCAARFNGVDTMFSVPDNSVFSFSGQFDIYIWAKWSSTATQYMMAKRTLSGNGLAISINRFSTGDISVEADGKFATATGSFNDDVYHLIRAYRDSTNTVRIAIDDSIKDSVAQASNMFLATALKVGVNHNDISHYTGDMNILRIYNGGILSATDATRLFTNRNATTLTKFSGNITKISKELDHKQVTAQSSGKILGETEVRGEIFLCRSPEFIIEDLMKNNTSLITHSCWNCHHLLIVSYMS